jgi:hypothetical protein
LRASVDPTEARNSDTVFKTVDGIMKTPENTGNPAHQRSLAPHLLHDTCKNDPDLAAVVAAWPELPVAIRQGIVVMVKAATGGRGG